MLAFTGSSWADTASLPPPVAPLPPPPASPPGAALAAEATAGETAASTQTAIDSAWESAFVKARAAMTAGRFADAASTFAELERNAPTNEKRAVCRELTALAKQWASAGLKLTLPRLAAQPAPALVRLDERTTDEISILYLNAVVYGLGSGLWLAVQTEPKDAAGAVLPTLLLAGAAAGAVAGIDHGHHFGYGVPASAVTGMYIGLEEGITWSVWNQARSPFFDEWQGKTVATVIWGSATVGAITGAVVGATVGTTPGRASYVGSTALWGSVLTGLIAGAISADDRGQRDDNALLGAALGVNAGTVAGVLSAGTLSPSVARVRFIDLGGIAGGLLAGGLFVSAANDASGGNAQGLLLVTALGIGGGLALSSVLTQGMPADRGAYELEPPPAVSIEPTLLPVRGGTMLGAMGRF